MGVEWEKSKGEKSTFEEFKRMEHERLTWEGAEFKASKGQEF